MNDQPKFDGSVRMSRVDIEGAMRARIIHLVRSGEMTQAQAGRYYGIPSQRVSEMLAPEKPAKPAKLPTIYTRAHDTPERREVVRLAKQAKSFWELQRISGRGGSFVRTTLLLMAPEEFDRLKGAKKAAPVEAPPPAEIDWSERGKEYVTHPNDKWLAESLARAASFVSVTKEGRTVRLVPPLHEAHPRALPGAAA